MITNRASIFAGTALFALSNNNKQTANVKSTPPPTSAAAPPVLLRRPPAWRGRGRREEWPAGEARPAFAGQRAAEEGADGRSNRRGTSIRVLQRGKFDSRPPAGKLDSQWKFDSRPPAIGSLPLPGRGRLRKAWQSSGADPLITHALAGHGAVRGGVASGAVEE
jgi:hypothetical protein